MKPYTMVLETFAGVEWKHEFEIASDTMAMAYASRVCGLTPVGSRVVLFGYENDSLEPSIVIGVYERRIKRFVEKVRE